MREPTQNSSQPAVFMHWMSPAVLLGVSFVFCFLQTLRGLGRIWIESEEYSYALAIPAVIAYIIWRRWDAISRSAVSPNAYGGLAFFALLPLAVYGILGSSPTAVRLVLPMLLLAVIWFCYGLERFRLLAFPVFLSVFMLPLPTVFQTKIGVPLKHYSTMLGELLLRLADVSVFVEGNIIDLGVTQLQVVDACNGLRYILPLTALAAIFAYFFEKSRWKALLLIASAVPIAVFTNGVRIAVTGYLAQHYGSKIAEGFFHGFSGWIIFVFALLILLGLYILLQRTFPSSRRKPSPIIKPLSRKSSAAAHKAAVAASCCSLLLVGSLNYAAIALPPLSLSNGFEKFPLKFDRWDGRRETMDPKIISLSGAEDAFNGTYMSKNGEIVSLYIGYRGSPFTESENFFHSPDVCLPSLGWTTIVSADHTVTGVKGFEQIIVRKMLIEKTGLNQLVYFWFQTKNYVSANVNTNRFHLTLHALSRNNTYDLFIRPITPLLPGETVQDAEQRLDGFVQAMTPHLLQFLSQHLTGGPDGDV